MGIKVKLTAAILCIAAVISTSITVSAAPPDAFRMGRGMEVLINMYRDLNLFYVDDVDPDKLLTDAAAGMTASLDPYTEYISEDDMSMFEVLTTGRYGGVGSLIRKTSEGIVFAEPYKGSPADKAGIVIGDLIVEIDGRDATKMTSEEVSAALKGEPGTKINIKVRKFFSGDIVPLEIKREIINIPGIPYYGMVSDSVGYIINSDFTDKVNDDMRNAVMSLKAQGAKSIILDYRNNGGGILQEAVKILSFFVPRGTEVVSMRGKRADQNAVFTTQHDPIDTEIPLVVLVNNGSASSAEIVAGALQDLDRAVVIGRRTFGKGLVQSTRPMDNKSYLKLTTAKYYLPSGRCIQAIDYAKRSEDGTINYIPDSLINEFTTRAGRKVYDGGGVMPDIKLDAEYVSRFAFIVYGKGYIFDFVDEWMRNNTDRMVNPDNFALTDDDYAAFTKFMEGKNVGWESETKRLLKQLKSVAKSERYLESISEQLSTIESGLDDDADTGLQLYRKELTELIENEILLRKTYNEGMLRHNSLKDNDIKEAVELLHDLQRYNTIITSVDTEKK